MELDTRAILLLPLVLAVLLHPAAANDSTPRCSGGLSLRLVPSAGWNSTMHVNGDGFLHLDEATTTVLTYSVAITVVTSHGHRTYDLELDTASSLTWMQCVPTSHPFTQMPPSFNPVASRTFRHVSRQSTLCDGPFTRAVRVLDHPPQWHACKRRARQRYLRLQGCAGSWCRIRLRAHHRGVPQPRSARRRPRPGQAETIAIWTQLHQHGHGGRFSYCLFGPGHPNRHGFLRFRADIPAIGHMRSTSILYMRLTTEPDFSPYFVCLTGASVAEQHLRLPGGWIRELFQRHRSGDGRWSSGCVIDPGTGTTVMIKPAYNLLVHAMKKHVRRLGLLKVERDGYPVCFRGATRAAFQLLPTVTLHFDNDLVLQPQQLFVLIQQDACLTVMPSDHITIIGAMQQVDMRFVYDIAAGKIHFAPNGANKLFKEKVPSPLPLCLLPVPFYLGRCLLILVSLMPSSQLAGSCCFFGWCCQNKSWRRLFILGFSETQIKACIPVLLYNAGKCSFTQTCRSKNRYYLELLLICRIICGQ